MRNIKLHLMYDGTAYHGWQMQKNVITVQQVVEEGLSKIFGGNRVVVHGCSRTDAGVHARDYVCSFFTEAKIPAEKIPFALNTCMPPDVRATFAEDMPETFHAQFSAKSKIYSYTVLKIDIEKIRYAAALLEGKHDFRTFMSIDATQTVFVKNMYSINVSREGDLITFALHADGYLYNMVRIICGTLVFMGSGVLNYLDMPQVLASLDRRRAGMTAPPQGLVLEKVFY